jgi:hypothetical protein
MALAGLILGYIGGILFVAMLVVVVAIWAHISGAIQVARVP